MCTLSQKIVQSVQGHAERQVFTFHGTEREERLGKEYYSNIINGVLFEVPLSGQNKAE